MDVVVSFARINPRLILKRSQPLSGALRWFSNQEVRKGQLRTKALHCGRLAELPRLNSEYHPSSGQGQINCPAPVSLKLADGRLGEEVQEAVQAEHEEHEAEDEAGGDGKLMDDGFHDGLLGRG